jgi:hypothetical protein
MSADNNPLDDFLKGGKAISDFLNEPYHRVQRMIASKQIPAGKLGGLLIGSKRRIAAALDKIASGEKA